MLYGTAIVMALQVIIIGIAFFKGAQEAYMPLMTPVMLLSTALVGIAVYAGGSLRFAGVWVVLLQIGVLLQILLLPGAYQQIRVLVLLAIVIVPLASWFLELAEGIIATKGKWVFYGGFAVMTLSYVILALFGSGVGGITRWVIIGGVSIQITEVVRLVGILMIALALYDKTTESNKRYLKSVAVMAASLLFFLLVSELGTLIVLGATFLVMCFLFLPLRFTFINLALISVVLLAGAILFFIVLGGNMFTDSTFIVRTVHRVNSRISVFLDPSIEPLGIGYQASQARLAIALGGLFGSSYRVHVPVIASDYAFVGLLLKMGGITGIIVIVAFSALLSEGAGIICKQVDGGFKQAVCTGFIWSIIIQAGLIIGGSTGFLPLTGIPVPFLSHGGTYFLILNAMMGYLLMSSCRSQIKYPSLGGRRHEKISRINPVLAPTNTN